MKIADIIRLAAFVLVVVIGAAYPVKKILDFEYPDREPEIFLFKTGAIDPVDHFRGRFVTLNFEASNADIKSEPDVCRYAVLKADKDGFATVSDIVGEKPGDDVPAVELESAYRTGSGKNKSYRVSFPFSKFYMNENDAPLAEKIVAEATRSGKGVCALKVKVYGGGKYSVDDLLVNGKPIRDVIAEENAKTGSKIKGE